MNSENMLASQEYPQPHNSFRQRLWNWLTAPSASLQDAGEQHAARLAASFLFVIGLLDLIGAFARAPRLGLVEAFSGGLGFSLVSTLVAYAISRTRWYRLGIFIFSLSFSISAYTSIISQGNEADFGTLILVYVPISLIVAASFLSPWAVFLLAGLNIGALFSTRFFGITYPENFGALSGITATIGLVLILLSNFRNNIEKARLEEVRKINRELEALSSNLEQRVNERTAELAVTSEQATKRADQLSIVANLSRSLASLSDLDSLLRQTTELVSQRMGFYHTGIFLLDGKREYAILEAANSEGGQRMLSRNHRLRVGSEGIVGYATGRGLPRIALDVGADAVYFDNPDLPDTRSEVALPLKSGETVIGALDIQSIEANAFSNEDVAVFTVLADQLAIAIQNARSLEQARVAAAEAEAFSRQLVGQAWLNIKNYTPIVGYRFDGSKPEPLTQYINDEQAGSQNEALSVPVQLRGTLIGRLCVKPASAGYQWSEDEIAIIRATAERVALAAENARLILESQKSAAKEQVIGEISSKISASAEIERIMQVAVGELRKALGASEIVLKIGNEN